MTAPAATPGRDITAPSIDSDGATSYYCLAILEGSPFPG